MRALALLSVGGLGAVLVATWLNHAQSAHPEDVALPRPVSTPSANGPAGPAAVNAAEVQALADRILARPLFNPDRRPGAAAAQPGVADAALPRLSAVLVSGRGRSVIFAGPGKPVTLNEGGRIGAYTVQSIGAGQVTLAGPDGARVLRPMPDRAAASVPAPAAPSMLDLLRQGAPMPTPGGAVQR